MCTGTEFYGSKTHWHKSSLSYFSHKIFPKKLRTDSVRIFELLVRPAQLRKHSIPNELDRNVILILKDINTILIDDDMYDIAGFSKNRCQFTPRGHCEG